MEFLLRHYEKLILAFCLLLLLCGIAFVGISAKRTSDELSKNQREASSSVKGGSMVADADISGYNVEKYLNDPRKICSILEDGEEGSQKGSMIESRPLILCKNEKCARLISLSEGVVEFKCPFCGTVQDMLARALTEKDDFDKDGLPDLFERKYPEILDDCDPGDAVLDADKDGFTNLEEYRAGTDLNDPKSCPPLATLLRVVRVTRLPVPLKLLEIYKPRKGGDDKAKWEITLEVNRRRKGGNKIGDVVAGYKIVDAGFEAAEGGEVAYMEFSSVKSPEDTYKVVVKETVREKKGNVQLYFLLSRSESEVKHNKAFQVRCKEGGEFELSTKMREESARRGRGAGMEEEPGEPAEKKDGSDEAKLEYYRLESIAADGTKCRVALLKGKGGAKVKSYDVPKLDEEKDFTHEGGRHDDGMPEEDMGEPGGPRKPRPPRSRGKGNGR